MSDMFLRLRLRRWQQKGKSSAGGKSSRSPIGSHSYMTSVVLLSASAWVTPLWKTILVSPLAQIYDNLAFSNVITPLRRRVCIRWWFIWRSCYFCWKVLIIQIYVAFDFGSVALLFWISSRPDSSNRKVRKECKSCWAARASSPPKRKARRIPKRWQKYISRAKNRGHVLVFWHVHQFCCVLKILSYSQLWGETTSTPCFYATRLPRCS